MLTAKIDTHFQGIFAFFRAFDDDNILVELEAQYYCFGLSELRFWLLLSR